jgi:hypothetical protein
MAIVVAKGGLPVTVVTSGALALPDNGIGVAITIVPSGGLPVMLISGAAPPVEDQLVSISPTSMPANTPTLLTANGSNFQGTSRIEVGGTIHTTTFVSASKLTATISKNAGTLPVKIKTGTAYSNAINLVVT